MIFFSCFAEDLEGGGNEVTLACSYPFSERKRASWNANGRLFGTRKQGAHCHYCCCCSCLVARSYLTLCDPMDCNPPDSSVHGILQARILERVAIFFSRGSSWHGIEPASPALVFLFVCLFFNWATWNTPLPLLLGSYPRATSLDQGRQRMPDLLKTCKERTFSSFKGLLKQCLSYQPCLHNIIALLIRTALGD